MQFGFMYVPRSLDESIAVATAGESYGFDWISVADSPTVYQDSYLHQLEIARHAPSVKVGPMVSHVVVRHPVIVANLFATMNEFTGGRMIGTVATGNSAARGLGLKPAKLADLRQAVETIQSHWRGEGGPYQESTIPQTGLQRQGCPILIAADGPKAAETAGLCGDGILYGGTLDPEVRRRRLAAAKITEGRQAWIAPTVSLKETHAEVRADLGAMAVAMANRAMRGDLDERGVPPEIQEDVLEMRRVYDYAFHADNSRPRNTGLVSERLTDFLIDTLCVWGDEARFRTTIDALAEEGWTGIMFILGQASQEGVVHELGGRLRALGYLPG
jgi:5,10-methylenetetrahydromethanopterin reductase